MVNTDNTNKINQTPNYNKNIPVALLVEQSVAKPVAHLVEQPVAKPVAHLVEQSVAKPVTTQVNSITNIYPTQANLFPLNQHLNQSAICRDCGHQFIRDPFTRGSASYFRCPSCSSTFLERTFVASCCIS